MKVAAAFTTLVIILTVFAILTWHYARNSPEPGRYSSQTIQTQTEPETTKHIELHYKARIATRDIRTISDRIRRYLDDQDVQYETRISTNRAFKTETSDARIAQTLSTLDSERDRLTPRYAQWPEENTEPPRWEEADLYTITVVVRPLHSHPNIVRASTAAGTAAVCLAILAAFWADRALKRRARERNPTAGVW